MKCSYQTFFFRFLPLLSFFVVGISATSPIPPSTQGSTLPSTVIPSSTVPSTPRATSELVTNGRRTTEEQTTTTSTPQQLCGISSDLTEHVEIKYVIGIYDEIDEFQVTRTFESFDFQFFNVSNTKHSYHTFKPIRIKKREHTVSYDPFSDLLFFSSIGKTSSVYEWDRKTEHKGNKYPLISNNVNVMNSIDYQYSHTSHYNPITKCRIFVMLYEDVIMITNITKMGKTVRHELSLPKYMKTEKVFSYADSNGIDYLLFNHRMKWIYRQTLQDLIETKRTFFKVFNMMVPPGWSFVDFMHADETGIVSVYTNDISYRYIYSIVSEKFAWKSYCIHESPKMLKGSLILVAVKRPDQSITPSLAQALRSAVGYSEPNPLSLSETSTLIMWLVYLAFGYLTIFLIAQLWRNPKIGIDSDLKFVERELSRLSPVIEPVVLKVNQFLNDRVRMRSAK